MAIDPNLIIKHNSPKLDLILRHPNKKRSLGDDNLLNRSERHKSIKLLHNQMWIDPIGKHPQNPSTHNNHHILDNMNLLHKCRIFEISDKTELFFNRLIGYFGHNCFGPMIEQYHNSLINSISAYLNIFMPDQLVWVRIGNMLNCHSFQIDHIVLG